MTPPRVNEGVWETSHLRVPGRAAQLQPHKPSFLGREVAAGLRGERGPCSLFSAEKPPGPVEGAKDQLYLCLTLGLPAVTGNGAHHGKAPFPHHRHPMFPALPHEEPHITYRVISILRSRVSRFIASLCLPAPVDPAATAASPNSASPRAPPQGPAGAVSQLSTFPLSCAGPPRSLPEAL